MLVEKKTPCVFRVLSRFWYIFPILKLSICDMSVSADLDFCELSTISQLYIIALLTDISTATTLHVSGSIAFAICMAQCPRPPEPTTSTAELPTQTKSNQALSMYGLS